MASVSTFFHSTVNTFKKNSIKLKNFVWAFSKVLPLKTVHLFKFRYVSVPKVKQLLQNLNRLKSTGPDQISAQLITDCAHILAVPIVHLSKITLMRWTIRLYRNNFKMGRVSAIYKSGEKVQFNTYCPITVLPIVSKVIERCVYNQLINYLERNKLLSD